MTQHSVAADDSKLSAWLAAKRFIVDGEPTSSPTARRRGYGPDAMCIGAQKAGTTWLYANMSFHPFVWLPPIKELHFFKAVHLERRRADVCAHLERQVAEARAWWNGPEGRQRDSRDTLACLDHIAGREFTDEWYTRIFDFRASEQVAIDVGPGYSLLPRDGIRHALSINPNVSVIAILRDPVERALSQARMLAGPNADADAIWGILRSDAMHVLLEYSDYPRWLARWRGLIHRQQMFVTCTNIIRSRPLEVLASLCVMLGIPFHPNIFPEATSAIFTGTAANALTDEMRAFVRTRMERICDELRRDWPEIAADLLDPSESPG